MYVVDYICCFLVLECDCFCIFYQGYWLEWFDVVIFCIGVFVIFIGVFVISQFENMNVFVAVNVVVLIEVWDKLCCLYCFV